MSIGQFMPMFSVGSTYQPDPYSDYVVMSLDMNTLAGGAPVDKSNMPTAFVVGGAPVLDAVNTLFGKPSILFSGTGQYYHQARPTEAYYDLAASGDFCVDLWFNMQVPNSGIYGCLTCHKITSGGNEPQLLIQPTATSGKYRVVLNAVNADRIISSYIIDPGTWYHVSYGRAAGNRWFMYINGVLIGTYTNTNNMSTMSMTLGASGWNRSTNATDKFKGNMANLRWWNGVSPRDGVTNFTPPSAPWGPVITLFENIQITNGNVADPGVPTFIYRGYMAAASNPTTNTGSIDKEGFIGETIDNALFMDYPGYRAPQVILVGAKTRQQWLRLNCVTPLIQFRSPSLTYPINKFQLTGSNLAGAATTPSVATSANGQLLFPLSQITHIERRA